VSRIGPPDYSNSLAPVPTGVRNKVAPNNRSGCGRIGVGLFTLSVVTGGHFVAASCKTEGEQ